MWGISFISLSCEAFHILTLECIWLFCFVLFFSFLHDPFSRAMGKIPQMLETTQVMWMNTAGFSVQLRYRNWPQCLLQCFDMSSKRKRDHLKSDDFTLSGTNSFHNIIDASTRKGTGKGYGWYWWLDLLQSIFRIKQLRWSIGSCCLALPGWFYGFGDSLLPA